MDCLAKCELLNVLDIAAPIPLAGPVITATLSFSSRSIVFTAPYRCGLVRACWQKCNKESTFLFFLRRNRISILLSTTKNESRHWRPCRSSGRSAASRSLLTLLLTCARDPEPCGGFVKIAFVLSQKEPGLRTLIAPVQNLNFGLVLRECWC